MLRFQAPTRDALDRLATGAPPEGLVAEPASREFRRDIYFDTVGADLEQRGVTVRLRISTSGQRVLSVDIRERQEDARITRRHAEQAVPDADPAEIFTGRSEPVRLLAGMVDPSRLQVQLELETSRWTREIRDPSSPGARVVALCDAVTLRHEELVTEFDEVEIRLPEESGDEVDGLVQRIQSEFGLRVTLASTLARAREALEKLELDVLEQRVRGAREVAVVAHDRGRIAMVEEDGMLRVPTGAGWGEEACRHVLRSVFGRTQGQLRSLGTSAGVGTRPAVQVWLAERIPQAGKDEAGGSLRWIAIEDALALVGSPALRNAPTLAALHMTLRQRLIAPAAPSGGGAAVRRKDHPLRALREAKPGALAKREDEQGEGGPSPDMLINAETSELAFNERVLALAEDRRTPLLARVRFVSILGSNLDEFFMTRVAGYHQQVASESTKLTLDGRTPAEQLDVIAVRARHLYARAYEFLWERLLPDLEAQEIRILGWPELEEEDREYLSANYGSQLGAVLTPLAADPSHPFPHIRNLRPHLGIIVRVPETDADHFAAIELPGDLPRFVPLPGGRSFVPLEEVIASTLPSLYAGMEIVAAHTFRVTRSANFTLEDETIGDVLQAVAEKVRQRPLGPVVRLEVEEGMPQEMRDLLLRELQFEAHDRVAALREEDVYPVPRLVDLFALHEIAELPLEDLHYPPLERSSPLDPDRSIFDQMAEREVLVRFPYDSFEASVERLLVEAASDPEVVSIRITLYRTNRSSRVVELLRKARRKGKDVVALVELKASFDESRNIEWARSLESAGIHVVYGPPHLKVHAKVALVVRREAGELRRYAYIGTGNLNAATAAAYTDLGLLSTDETLGKEVQDVFNGLTGYSVTTEYEHLLVAPFNMRRRFLEMIEREVAHAEAGRGGLVRIKINGLTDRELIAALYRASQAGVKVEMIVRGICALRPGVPGISDNITVVSILGRFLEHARIYRFENAGDPEYYIGSADWRPRNLSKRVEVVTPILRPEQREVLDGILEGNLSDGSAWELQADGSYLRRNTGEHLEAQS